MLLAWLVFAVSAVGGLVVLGIFCWRLYQQTKALLRKVESAGARIDEVSSALATVQARTPAER
jgi:cytochrome bd-type quinol oxidase subunit 1